MTAAAPSPLDQPIDLWPVDGHRHEAHCSVCGKRCTPMADYDEPVCHQCDELVAWVGLPFELSREWYGQGGAIAAAKARAADV